MYLIIEIKAKIACPRDRYKWRIIGGLKCNLLGHHIAFLRLWIFSIYANKLVMVCQVKSKAGKNVSVKCNGHIVNIVSNAVQQKENRNIFTIWDKQNDLQPCLRKPDWNTPCIFFKLFFKWFSFILNSPLLRGLISDAISIQIRQFRQDQPLTSSHISSLWLNSEWVLDTYSSVRLCSHTWICINLFLLKGCFLLLASDHTPLFWSWTSHCRFKVLDEVIVEEGRH